MAGRKLNDIIHVLRRRGLIAITALRLVPLAPFTVEGVVAGAVGIKLWHFMVGTAIGMLPARWRRPCSVISCRQRWRMPRR